MNKHHHYERFPLVETSFRLMFECLLLMDKREERRDHRTILYREILSERQTDRDILQFDLIFVLSVGNIQLECNVEFEHSLKHFHP